MNAHLVGCTASWRHLVTTTAYVVLLTCVMAIANEIVSPRLPSASSFAAHFMPTDATIYTKPVLVVLAGLQPDDEAMIFMDDALIGTRYTTPFWLHQTTHLTAVINGRDILAATYKLHVPPAPVVRIYPPAGTFLGGVSVFVYQASADAEYVWCVNGTGCNVLTHFIVTLRTVGVQMVTVRATFRGGLCSEATREYIIYAASPPQLTPAATTIYHKPVHVRCYDPLARPLALHIDGLADGGAVTPYDGDATRLRLDLPGRYVLSCGYVDDLHNYHSTQASYLLAARILSPPSFDPPCNTVFPYGPLLLSLYRVARNESSGDKNAPSPSEAPWRVTGSVTGGTLQFVVRASDEQYNYAVLPPPPPQPAGDDDDGAPHGAMTRLEVNMWTVSDSIFDHDSPSHSCVYPLLPPDAADRSAFFHMLPSCPVTRSAKAEELYVTSTCLYAVVANLAHCLHLYLPTPVAALRVGPMVLLTLTGLDTARRTMYDELITSCLSHQRDPPVTSVHAETQDSFELATSWRVVDTAMAGASVEGLPIAEQGAFHVWSGLPILIEVRGFGLRRHDFYLVRHAYTCDDVGVAPTQVMYTVGAAVNDTQPDARVDLDGGTHDVWNETRVAALLSHAWRERATLLFVTMPSAGRYKLCARRVAGRATAQEVVYLVPPRHSLLHIHAAPSPVLHVDDDRHRQDGVEGCGGALDGRHAQRTVELNVVATVVAPPQYTQYAYTASGSAWRTVSFHAATRSDRLIVDYVGDTAVSISLGPTTTATETCVFYDTGAEVSRRGSLRYDFHSLNAAHHLPTTVTTSEPVSTPSSRAQAAMVVMMLHGAFSAEELLVIEVRVSSHCAPATQQALREAQLNDVTTLLASVEARSSAALLNYSMAVSDHAVHLQYVRDWAGCGMTVHVLRDGQAVPSAVEAARVVLSPLSLAMWHCTRCRSGYCVTRNQTCAADDGDDVDCVCIGEANKTAYVCDADGRGGSGDAADGSATPTSERLWIMVSYIILLAAIAAGIFIAIGYNARHSRARVSTRHDESAATARQV